MKKRLIIAVLIVAAGIAAALTVRFGNGRDDGAITASGTVEVTEVNAGFTMPGRVIALLTDEGHVVKLGEKIAVLDSAESEAQVAQGRAALENAEAQRDKAKTDFKRYKALLQSGAVSTQQMDSAKTAYDVALSQVRQAGATLKTGEVKLRDTVLYAPVSGMVLRKNVESGEAIGPGTPIVTIGDLGNPWVKVYVKEDRLGRVKLGQRAEVKSDSYPGKVYEGRVTYISSEAEFTPKNVQTQEERVKLVFGVKVSVANVNDELRPGMPADVRIPLK